MLSTQMNNHVSIDNFDEMFIFHKKLKFEYIFLLYAVYCNLTLYLAGSVSRAEFLDKNTIKLQL